MQCRSWPRPNTSSNRGSNRYAQEFVAEVALAAPTVQVDAKLMQQYEEEMAQASNVALPDEEDSDL